MGINDFNISIFSDIILNELHYQDLSYNKGIFVQTKGLVIELGEGDMIGSSNCIET